MINSIDKLKNFGCFEDYQNNPDEVKPFNRINILFGNNGSGKTTLSNLFFLLSKHCKDKSKLHSEYLEVDTELTLSSSFGNITEKNISSLNNNDIYVFNSKFISDHVFNGTTTNVDSFNAEIKLTNEEISKLDARLSQLNKRKEKVDNWLSSLNEKLNASWDHYKDEFQDIVSDARLTNKKPQVTEDDTDDFDATTKALEKLYADYEKKNSEESTIEKLNTLSGQVNSIQHSPVDFSELNRILNKPVSVEAKGKVQEKINTLQKKVTEKKWDEHIGDLGKWLRRCNKYQQTIHRQDLYRYHISFIRSAPAANLALSLKSPSRRMFYYSLARRKTTPPRYQRATKKTSRQNRLEDPQRLD